MEGGRVGREELGAGGEEEGEGGGGGVCRRKGEVQSLLNGGEPGAVGWWSMREGVVYGC